MIFVTVGTQLPFDRLIRAVDVWCSHAKVRCFAQIADPGTQGYFPKSMEWASFLSPVEFDRHFSSADLVIAHAGMGSIISSIEFNKPIVINAALRSALKEHRNDHQLATAKRFRTGQTFLLLWMKLSCRTLSRPLVPSRPGWLPSLDVTHTGRLSMLCGISFSLRERMRSPGS
jgi:UDP-N-acetylglucosamine transferase subunit ALG13